ncbi:hypothetical protein GYMLUDRAFT_240367 [Collybiopsis luxurians FD-317 M1]|nr:hypothetical protein GYMLUDRAFT_240367 [Collybiopsis luxurians FD-317 M1]
MHLPSSSTFFRAYFILVLGVTLTLAGPLRVPALGRDRGRSRDLQAKSVSTQLESRNPKPMKIPIEFTSSQAIEDEVSREKARAVVQKMMKHLYSASGGSSEAPFELKLKGQPKWYSAKGRKSIRFQAQVPNTWPKPYSLGKKLTLPLPLYYKGTVYIWEDKDQLDWDEFSGFMTDEYEKRLVFEARKGGIVGETNVQYDEEKTYGDRAGKGKGKESASK